MEINEALDQVGVLEKECKKFLSDYKGVGSSIRHAKNQLSSLNVEVSIKRKEVDELTDKKNKIYEDNEKLKSSLKNKESELASLEGSLKGQVANCNAIKEKAAEEEVRLKEERVVVKQTQDTLNSLIAENKVKKESLNKAIATL